MEKIKTVDKASILKKTQKQNHKNRLEREGKQQGIDC